MRGRLRRLAFPERFGSAAEHDSLNADSEFKAECERGTAPSSLLRHLSVRMARRNIELGNGGAVGVAEAVVRGGGAPAGEVRVGKSRRIVDEPDLRGLVAERSAHARHVR